MKIPYLDLKATTASFGGELEKCVAEVVSSGRYLLGQQCECFEDEYSKYIGVRHTVACGNGLDALTLIYRALMIRGDLKPGDEVIVPANTFVASVLAISENGLVPVLVEPSEVTYELDEEKLEQAITGKTRSLMLVHLYGRNAYSEKIEKICRRHNLLLVEDNAQAQGALYFGENKSSRRTGSLGIAAGHSFYPGKNLGALGDAGAVTTNDDSLAQIVRELANYGSSKKYIFKYEGKNSRMDEIQAAVLRVKLRRLDADNNRRIEIAEQFFSKISNPYIRIPAGGKRGSNVWHIYPLMTPYRDRLREYLDENGIGTLIHYPVPPHHQECYSGKGILRLPEPLIVTDRLANEEVSIPLNQNMTNQEALYVVETINKFKL